MKSLERRSSMAFSADNGDDQEKDLGELEAAEKLITRWDSMASVEGREQMIFDGGNRRGADDYLLAIDEIHRSLDSITVVEGGDDSSKVSSTMQVAMARLEDEFHNVLLNHSSPVDVKSLVDANSSVASSVRTVNSGEFDVEEYPAEEDRGVHKDEEEQDSSQSSASYRSTSSIREIDMILPNIVDDLQSIAERMIAAGYLRECIQVYGNVRKSQHCLFPPC